MQEALAAHPHRSTHALSAPRRIGGALLGLPLFLKVLIANVVVVGLGAGLGTWFTLTFVAGPGGTLHWGAIGLMVVFGFAGSVLINALVLSLALQPLRALERTVDRVASGDLSARVDPVVFYDPDMERMSDTLNAMLDVVQRHQVQVQALSEQVLVAQEEERKRISRELHDETAQSLTTLLVRLKVMERARSADELREQIQELRELTASTIEAVRGLAVELRPTTLDNLGLVAALEAYTESYAQRMPLHVSFRAEGFNPRAERLPPQVELVLYRVVQEALTNVAKHAGARHAAVELTRTRREVVARVTDDGQGFEVMDAMQSRERGLGLFGMQERLGLVNGTLDIDSTPGGGTTVRAVVPLGPLRGIERRAGRQESAR
ncbi:MAG: HAMP domain-containing sensor histidine kinase [Chloroflexi bacterium]|nr:HAMP domain-containing sensor histidine kinase [Chloroflexota bacterium]